MTLALSVILMASLGASIQAQEPAQRLPLPDAAAVKDAEKLIKDLFKDEYSKRAPSDRMALAKKLLEQAEASKDDPPSRYVLLRDVVGLSAQAGDLSTALKAIDHLGRAFLVDVPSLKADTLSTVSKSARSVDDYSKLAAAYLKLVGDALQVDDFAAAERAASAASTQAKKGQNLVLVNQAAARSKEVADLKSRYEKLRKMKQVLIANPEDPAANHEVGQYECFAKDNWSEGLALLAKGSDATLKDLATRDLAGALAPAEQAAVGDGWWGAAEKLTGQTRETVRIRARGWYEKAAPKLTGLILARTDKRLLELRMDFLNRGTWTDVSDPKLYGKPGTELNLNVGDQATLAKLPGEVDGLSLRVKIPAGKITRACIEYEIQVNALFIYQETREVQTAKLEGNTWKSKISTPSPAKEQYVLTVLLVEGEYIGHLDGKEFFRIPTTREYLTSFVLWVPVGTATVTFDQIRLRKKQ